MRRTFALVAVGATIAATLGMAGATGAAEPPTGKRDIVLVADSTGLTEADWTMQKRAYLAMLDDTVNFPLDGSTSVAFIQYAATKSGGQASRVTVPFIRLDGISARGKLTQSIREASLLAPEKAGIDALSAAAQELSEHGTKGASASVCATANAPWDQATLTKGVGATKSSGATRLSMLTLATAALSEKLADQTFGAAVFGEGSVVSARNVPQFGNLVSSSCLLPALRMEAIEVNQAIQDWNNSMPLVQYKDTIVRVFIETVALSSTTTSGLLHGTRDGIELSGSPLSPINEGGTVTVDSFVDYAAERAQLDASLNFRLPTSWLAGDVTLTFEAPSSLTCAAAPAGQQDCDVDVSFHEAEEPSVNYVSVPYDYLGTHREPTDAALVENMYRTEDIFPVRYVNFDFDWMPWTVDDTIPDLELVNSYLYLYSLYEDCLPGLCSDTYYGVLDGPGGGLANDIPGSVASGFLSGTGSTEAYGYGRNRGPHEIAHMVGAHHIVNQAENGTTSYGSTRVKNGWCTEEGGSTAPEYPYWRTSTSIGHDVPTLGPMGTDNTEIWGISPRFIDDNENLALIDPWYVFPLMSYCGALDTTSQYRWPSSQTYEVLADRLLSTRSRSTAAPAVKEGTPTIYVRGLVDPADVAATRFLPVAPVMLPRAPTATSGPWSIRLMDRKGKVLATRAFTMTESHGDAAEPGGGEPTSRMQFAVPFPGALATKIASMQLLRNQKVVATKRATVAAPTVSVSSPKSGMTLDGESVMITWAMQDRDSTGLTATVLYRTGPGAAWRPVAIDASGSSVTVPRRALSASNTGEFMVIANDGVRLGSAKVGPVRVANNAPILSLQQAEGNVVAAQNFMLAAAAWDSEDGVLDQQITWTSSLDGRIGTGREVDLEATDLSEGTHTVTVTVTDSGKLSASQTFTIIVSRVAEDFSNKLG